MDPASASCFAVLFGAVHKHDGRVRFLDEMYVTDQALTSVGHIWPEMKRRMDAILQTEEGDDLQWTIVCDEAAAGVRVELLDQFGVFAQPTQKAVHKKHYGISLIKDLYVADKLLVADRCKNFASETVGYFLNDKGEYIKKDDHLLDAARYLLHAAHYTMQPSVPHPDPEPIPLDERRRGYTPQEDMASLFGDHGVYLLDLEDDLPPI
jgi:hypothetical protein